MLGVPDYLQRGGLGARDAEDAAGGVRLDHRGLGHVVPGHEVHPDLATHEAPPRLCHDHLERHRRLVAGTVVARRGQQPSVVGLAEVGHHRALQIPIDGHLYP